MQRHTSSTRFLILIGAATVFVWGSGQLLPEVVASHFGASGIADGFMPRVYYVGFMVGMVLVVPLLLVLLPASLLRGPNARINLPNRDYWLAPERREETIAFLLRYARYFALMLAIFLCYAHWLVVRANMATPPSLSSPWFIGGLVIFMASAVVWVKMLFSRFRNVPR